MHIGTNNLKNKESVEDIANDIMDVAIFIRNEKTNVFASGLTVQNDRLNDKGKNVNSLLKFRYDEEKICFVNNTNINVGMLNNIGLHLNERGTTRRVIIPVLVYPNEDILSAWILPLQRRMILTIQQM